jgi:hypothetical protein
LIVEARRNSPTSTAAGNLDRAKSVGCDIISTTLQFRAVACAPSNAFAFLSASLKTGEMSHVDPVAPDGHGQNPGPMAPTSTSDQPLEPSRPVTFRHAYGFFMLSSLLGLVVIRSAPVYPSPVHQHRRRFNPKRQVKVRWLAPVAVSDRAAYRRRWTRDPSTATAKMMELRSTESTNTPSSRRLAEGLLASSTWQSTSLETNSYEQSDPTVAS